MKIKVKWEKLISITYEGLHPALRCLYQRKITHAKRNKNSEMEKRFYRQYLEEDYGNLW